MDDFGSRIKQAREEAALSREALAAAAGISFTMLKRFEDGHTRRFTPATIRAIAAATGKTPGWFFESEVAA